MSFFWDFDDGDQQSISIAAETVIGKAVQNDIAEFERAREHDRKLQALIREAQKVAGELPQNAVTMSELLQQMNQGESQEKRIARLNAAIDKMQAEARASATEKEKLNGPIHPSNKFPEPILTE